MDTAETRERHRHQTHTPLDLLCTPQVAQGRRVRAVGVGDVNYFFRPASITRLIMVDMVSRSVSVCLESGGVHVSPPSPYTREQSEMVWWGAVYI